MKMAKNLIKRQFNEFLKKNAILYLKMYKNR